MIAHGEPLCERFVHGQVQRPSQVGMTDQDQGGEGLAVHLVAEEQPQLFEHGLGEQVRFVEDDDGRAMLGGAEFFQGGANARHQARFAEGGFHAETEQEVAIQTGHAGGRVGEINDQIAIEIEPRREGAHGGGLARADFAGDEPEAAFVHKIRETRTQFFLTGGGEQVLGRNGARER